MWSGTTLGDYILLCFKQIITSQEYSKVHKQAPVLAAYLLYTCSCFLCLISELPQLKAPDLSDILPGSVSEGLAFTVVRVSSIVLPRTHQNKRVIQPNNWHSNQCWSSQIDFLFLHTQIDVQVCVSIKCSNTLLKAEMKWYSSKTSKRNKCLCTELPLPLRSSKRAGPSNPLILRVVKAVQHFRIELQLQPVTVIYLFNYCFF